jgi:hypothetical protein
MLNPLKNVTGMMPQRGEVVVVVVAVVVVVVVEIKW